MSGWRWTEPDDWGIMWTFIQDRFRCTSLLLDSSFIAWTLTFDCEVSRSRKWRSIVSLLKTMKYAAVVVALVDIQFDSFPHFTFILWLVQLTVNDRSNRKCETRTGSREWAATCGRLEPIRLFSFYQVDSLDWRYWHFSFQRTINISRWVRWSPWLHNRKLNTLFIWYWIEGVSRSTICRSNVILF